MDIRVDTAVTGKHIYVSGEVGRGNEEGLLLKLLGQNNACNMSISFLHANMVPGCVADLLWTYGRLGKIKVFVHKRNLYSYLFSLGVKCIHVRKRLLQSLEMDQMPADGIVLEKQQVAGFLYDLHQLYGYDYSGYHSDSISRRLKLAMSRENVYDFGKFKEMVLRDEDKFERLFLDFSINTTDFFRNPEVFDVIRNKILPYLNSYPHINIWCAGCSNGKEPYSLAILLKEAGMLQKTRIYATDINPFVIEEARNGLFSTATLESDIKNYRRAGGKKNFTDYLELRDTYMKVKGCVAEKILFFHHSIVDSGILNEFQMILCRNVLIYFSDSLQKRTMEYFFQSLSRNGFLVLGKSESLLQNEGYRYFNKYADRLRIFRRKP